MELRELQESIRHQIDFLRLWRRTMSLQNPARARVSKDIETMRMRLRLSGLEWQQREQRLKGGE